MSNPDLIRLLQDNGYKSLTAFAEAMHVDKATVSRWASGRIPAERVVQIEVVTGIPRHKLRPDLYNGGDA